MNDRPLRWLKGWLSPGVVPAVGPERLGPYPDREDAARAVKRSDGKYADYLNAYRGYYETRREADGWYAVRVLGCEQPETTSVQWMAGLGPRL